MNYNSDSIREKLVIINSDKGIDVEADIDENNLVTCIFSHSGVVIFRGLLRYKDMESLSELIKTMTEYFSKNIGE